ncbi:MAG: hypothetical protein GY940_16665 [bacterium]|nr:hypothetical protein [bacterium]
MGLIDKSHAHPREVSADIIIADRTSGVAIAHNHPAGNLPRRSICAPHVGFSTCHVSFCAQVSGSEG